MDNKMQKRLSIGLTVAGITAGVVVTAQVIMGAMRYMQIRKIANESAATNEETK